MLAATRERRANAGSKMGQMIESEDCDDFYKSTYGGFFDEDEDNVYASPAGSDSDEVDSDFDIDENDEPISEGEDEGTEKKKRKAGVFTKAYKEPAKPREVRKKESKPKKPMSSPERIEKLLTAKKLRQSTLKRSHEAANRQRLMCRGQAITKIKKKQRKLTQEEIMEEAKETEKINIKSLEKFQKFEVELRSKRRGMFKRKGVVGGPSIRYLSVTVGRSANDKYRSLVKEEPEKQEPDKQPMDESVTPLTVEIDVEETTDPVEESTDRLFSRTFVSFSEEKLMSKYFPDKKGPPRVLGQQRCAITGLAAKYKDPVTGLYYANLDAFRKIRSAYDVFLEQQNKGNPAVEAYLSWKRSQH